MKKKDVRLPNLYLRGPRVLASFISLICLTCLAWTAMAQPIYTCLDSRGRSITADRPIAECADRTQRELSGSGLVKRQVGPTLTAQEQVVLEEKTRLAAEVRTREFEERRRDRALMVRYPSQTQHDHERIAALAQVDEVIKSTGARRSELADKRRSITSELEFYAKDMTKVPGSLKRKLEENAGNTVALEKFIQEQEQEKHRLNQRFDDELVRLRQLWAQASPTAASAASAAGGMRAIKK